MTLGNTAPLALAILGLLLGMKHSTDPDHVIAVTTIVSGQRRLATAMRIGLVWGLGHSFTVLMVGAAIIIFKLAIPLRLGLAMEFAVALVLILLGLPATLALLWRILTKAVWTAPSADDTIIVHSHAHTHADGTHSHPHVHPHAAAHAHGHAPLVAHADRALPEDFPLGFAARRPLLKSFCVGLVHGLAGSAAIALLVLAAIPQPLWATIFLAVFCLGTIFGMTLITTAIGAPFMLAGARMARLHHGLVLGAGLLSFGFGIFLAWQIGVTDHLFGALPIWTPH